MTGNLITILKDDKLINIDEDALSKGDLVVLQTADIVPADLKLIETKGLEIDEFDITGELLPVLKDTEQDPNAYMGCRIIKGMGKGIVLAIKEQTEYGRIFHQETSKPKFHTLKPFDKKYLAVILLLLPSLFVQITQTNQVAGSIAFHAALAMIFIVLQNDGLFKNILAAKELKFLEQSKIKIHSAKILETTSRMTTLCFDKTGVLTTRKMNVQSVLLAGGTFTASQLSSINPKTSYWIKSACALCNDVLMFEKLAMASPIDKALVAFAVANGMDLQSLLPRARRIYDKPFDSEDRYMVCGFEIDGMKQYFAKGDPNIILRMCNEYITMDGETRRMDNEFWDMNLASLQMVNQSGGVVIALAYAANIDDTPQHFTFLSLLQLENPLQSGAHELIRNLADRGIRSLLVTGDRPETAGKIAEECGITRNSKMVLTGGSIARMELREVARQSSYCSVFARLIPSQKGILIHLLQGKKQCVGMVGDGVNDGIALKVADVSISFFRNSSPIARQFAGILINELNDLSILLASAQRYKNINRRFKIFRALTFSAIVLGVYAWVFTHI